MNLSQTATYRHPLPILYGIAADPAQYPMFFPGCTEALAVKKAETVSDMTLTLDLAAFQKEQVAGDFLLFPRRIVFQGSSSSFQKLDLEWSFSSAHPGTCMVEYQAHMVFHETWRAKWHAKTLKHRISQGLEALHHHADMITWSPQKTSPPSYQRAFVKNLRALGLV